MSFSCVLPATIAAMLGVCNAQPADPAHRVIDGDPLAGRQAIMDVACGVCHVIPGIPGAHGVVGPSLDKFANRSLIGGVAPNRPAVLTRWIRDAPSISPQTGMPELPVDSQEAMDIAAYLYTLR
jgi:cytochrome c